ncbi:hypothetical protein PAXRUDRAFT_790237 [Paxillus rubicundulus Ve08.2h10]|uniref:Acyl-CoA desaturase n=1 Tax=Paxillus rubicundulus Ve08.2h10 TaxID=930991 RepID=A0A0D0EAZ7_9AGAM|nr:hypothetical protein PAXRUDRAFT_790237 [Paxillus rubicundulus Ve08.2h10]
MTPPPNQSYTPPKIWWSNAVFFVSVHIAALAGAYHRPPTHVPRLTLLMSLVLWQLADFGVTIGYHRLYSHCAFRASLPVRIVLVALGSIAFQGSVKVYKLDRAYLRHRFTDDPIHDPYAATRGLLYSHMGWIFFKPKYERIEWVDREDLDNDPVVRFQHMYYVQIAFVLGYVVPIMLGYLWGDPVGAFVYGGLITRLAVWHCTFLVNSLAHWEGMQPYSDENTSRGNFILALLTGGEGNHNFHAFPHDYRSGPSRFDWDPSKWIIASLYHFGLVSSVRRARPQDIKEAKRFMNQKTHNRNTMTTGTDKAWGGPEWRIEETEVYAASVPEKCIVVIEGFVVDVTAYLKEHPGGAKVLRNYSIRRHVNGESWRDASWAFDGGLNNHSRAARRRMCELRVAKLKS